MSLFPHSLIATQIVRNVVATPFFLFFAYIFVCIFYFHFICPYVYAYLDWELIGVWILCGAGREARVARVCFWLFPKSIQCIAELWQRNGAWWRLRPAVCSSFVFFFSTSVFILLYFRLFCSVCLFFFLVHWIIFEEWLAVPFCLCPQVFIDYVDFFLSGADTLASSKSIFYPISYF